MTYRYKVKMVVANVFAAVILAPSMAGADPYTISCDLAAAELEYRRDVRIDVGDRAAHRLRLFERRYLFSRRPPVFAGVRAIELREQGYSDTIDANGTEETYVTFAMEDGGTVFGRYTGVSKSWRWPDGSRHVETRGNLALTGGTNPFQSLRGLMHIRTWVDPGADSSQAECAGEYWFDGLDAK